MELQTYDTLEAAILVATRAAIPAINQALWTAHRQGWLTDEQAESLDEASRARQTVVAAAATTPAPRRSSVGSRPRTPASLARRRRWAASGRMPPVIAEHYSPAQQAVLALVASLVAQHGRCDWPIARIAAVAGVAYSTAKATLRHARALGHIVSQERPRPGGRHDTSIISIVAPEWVEWIGKRRLPPPGDMLSTASSTGGISTSFRKRDLRRKPGFLAAGKVKRGSKPELRHQRAS